MVKKEKLRSKRYWLAALLLFLCTVLFCAAPAHAAKLNKTSLKITKGKSTYLTCLLYTSDAADE